MGTFETSTFAGPSPPGSPVTRGNPPVTTGQSLPPGATFQLLPPLDGCEKPPTPGLPDSVRGSPSCCDDSMAQTGHPGGMSVVMADGSVRVIRAGVRPAAYWAAITPAAGEVAPLD
ncbi:MAG TPA: H-X9-DG-CTERM domain-containing protein [Urbifossiella sp.]|nr:H-X9-DG-CTERM domain-containing protein [Urbifossiella sp.]